MTTTTHDRPTTSQNGTKATSSPFETPSVEAATQRIREVNERLIDASKSVGLVTVDAYEKTLQTLVDFEGKVAEATQLEWVSTLAATHAKFVGDLSASYTKSARDLLK